MCGRVSEVMTHTIMLGQDCGDDGRQPPQYPRRRVGVRRLNLTGLGWDGQQGLDWGVCDEWRTAVWVAFGGKKDWLGGGEEKRKRWRVEER